MESNSEIESLKLARENNQNDFQTGVKYETTLENTLSNIRKQKSFLKWTKELMVICFGIKNLLKF